MPINKNTWQSTLIKWKFTEVQWWDRTKAPASPPSKDLSLNFISVIRAALLHHFSLNMPFSSVSAFLVYQTPTSTQPWTRWLRTPCWDKLRHLLQSTMPGSAPARAVGSESAPKPISINLFFISLTGITAMFTSCLLRWHSLNIFQMVVRSDTLTPNQSCRVKWVCRRWFIASCLSWRAWRLLLNSLHSVAEINWSEKSDQNHKWFQLCDSF